MLDYKEREVQANTIYRQGLDNVKNKSVPKGQKYLPGTRVKIVDNLGSHMSCFPDGRKATVKYSYAHAYGGGDVKSYCLDIDGIGEVSWYSEEQIKALYNASNLEEN